MAVVYRAMDLRHDRVVAIKVLRPELASALGPERFLREIRIAAQLQHPHILGLIDSGEVARGSGSGPPILYYVMPFVDGESLREHLDRDGALPVTRVIRVMREVADALAKAHRSGVVHRDIKPDNILLADGHALVADFGVARAVKDASSTGTQTALGVAVGTPAYMAPEQVAADPTVDHRADIYALGVVGFEMLAGRLPFDAEAPHLMLAAHVTTPPLSVAELRPDAPPILTEAIMRCLEKDPDARFQSADELVGRLELLSTGTGETRGVSVTRRRRWPLGLAAMAVGVAAVLVLRRQGSSVQEAASPEFASLAVLPLVNLNRDSASEYFSDGITEEILSAVARIPGLRVAARTSAFTFKGQTIPAPEIARRLRVRHLLEGSVERAGRAVRVRARLVDGPRDTEVWSERFDQRADNVFALQDSVAGAIARELRARVGTGVAGDGLRASRTADPEAYDAYLRGLQALRGRAGVADLQRAIAQFERATARDSSFAKAWAGLASAWILMPEYGGAPADVAAPTARLAIARAAQLDSASSDVLAALGYLRRSYEWDWAGAEAAFRRALSVDPNAATIWQWLGETMDAVGRYADAEEALDHAEALDPVSPVVRLARGSHFLAAGNRPRARAEFGRALELQAGFWPASVQLLLLELVEGRIGPAESLIAAQEPYLPFDPALARAVLAGVRDRSARDQAITMVEQWQGAGTAPVIVAASFLALLQDPDRAFAVLEAGLDRREPHMALIRWWPALEPLHRDPRFAGLLRQLGLPPLP